jgi:microcystin degradation protein MlrC
MRGERQRGARVIQRILIGGIAHESNAFSAVQTDIEQFRQRVYVGGHDLTTGFTGTRTVIGGFLDGITASRGLAIPLIYASATPGGIVTRAAWRELREGLLDRIRAAGRVDGVLLALHGAMVTEDHADAEGDLLRGVRAIVGPRVPIVVTLDSHANISRTMVDIADALVGYTTYPHIDTYERGLEAATILRHLLTSHQETARALATPPMLVPLPAQGTTTDTPMRALLARASGLRARAGILNVTIAGGFPYSDVPDAGLRVVVTATNDQELAQSIADELAAEAWARREQFAPALTPVGEAIARVASAARFPVVLSDGGDNPGAGAPCDSTVLLRALHAAGLRNGVAIGAIADPETVAGAVAAGPEAEIVVRLGGKADGRHGAPVDAVARVVRITDGVFTNTGPMGAGGRTRMGRTVLLDLDGMHVIVTEQRVQAIDLSLFRSVGIEPTEARALVLKSSVHYRAAFSPIAAEMIDVDTPGISSPDLRGFSFRYVPRPIWPLDGEVGESADALRYVRGTGGTREQGAEGRLG